MADFGSLKDCCADDCLICHCSDDKALFDYESWEKRIMREAQYRYDCDMAIVVWILFSTAMIYLAMILAR